MAAGVRVVGPDLKRINAQLASLAPTVRKELVKEIRKAAEPAAAAARRAVLATPSRGGNTQLVKLHSMRNKAKSSVSAHRAEKRAARGGEGLRAHVARGIKVTVAPGSGRVTVIADGRLAQYLEGDLKPWKHPTYGHRPWQTQPSHPYFYDTVRRFRPQFNAAAVRAMKTASRSAGFR